MNNFYIFGLGNPGKEYKHTYHNLGEIIVNNIAKKNGKSLKKSAHFSNYTSIEHNESKIYLITPQTFMNLSGYSIKDWIISMNIPIHNILIIHDDLDLPLGNLKLRYNSTSGGHNGIQSIIDQLGSKRFYRLKLGIGPRLSDIPADQYVLSSMNLATNEINILTEQVLEKIDQWLKLSIQH